MVPDMCEGEVNECVCILLQCMGVCSRLVLSLCVVLSSCELGSITCLLCTIACHILTALCVHVQVKIICLLLLAGMGVSQCCISVRIVGRRHYLLVRHRNHYGL